MSYQICPRCKGSGEEPKVSGITTKGDGRCLACNGHGGRVAVHDPRLMPDDQARIGSRNMPLLISSR